VRREADRLTIVSRKLLEDMVI